jgi:hypothetical protein
MSNYPAGAEYDSRAPYNQSGTDDLCIYCDSKEIEFIARSQAQDIATRMNAGLLDGQESFIDDDFYDACLQDEFESRKQCKQCYLEEHADDWEEDV